MTSFQWVMACAWIIFLSSLLLGIVWRRAYRLCWSFPLYIVAVLVSDVLLVWRPSLFVWEFWLVNELTHSVLKFTLAAEVGWRMFGVLPGARATLASALLLVSLLTLWAVLSAPLQASPRVVAQTAMAGVAHGTAWLFGSLLAAKLYFRIPAHPLHQAILRGFVPFLLTFTVALGMLETYGANVRLLASHGYTIAYLLLLVYWNVVVWRKADDPQVPPEVMQKLQPWR
jgi:hypothetical protein